MYTDDTRRQYFVYSAPVVLLDSGAAGEIVPVTMNIQADAPFEANYMTVMVTQANLIVANWGGMIQINDSSVGRTLFNIAIPVSGVSGDGQLPYPFNPPRMFAANTSIVITITNPVVTATRVFVAFHGNKIFSDEDLDLGRNT